MFQKNVLYKIFSLGYLLPADAVKRYFKSQIIPRSPRKNNAVTLETIVMVNWSI